MATTPAVLLLGAPLSGKGTLVEALTNHYPTLFSWWESSTILKSYATKHDDERARAVKEIFSGEKLISPKLLNDKDLTAIIADYATTIDDQRTPLLDGVIRTERQAEYLSFIFTVRTVLYLDHANISEGEFRRRIAERNRSGETTEQAMERVRIAQGKTAPLLEFYGDKVFRIDASLPKMRIFQEARMHLRSVFDLAY